MVAQRHGSESGDFTLILTFNQLPLRYEMSRLVNLFVCGE